MDPEPGDAPRELRRGVFYWISRALAGALGILMIASGIASFVGGERRSGVHTFAIGLLFTFYGVGGGLFRRRAPGARTTTPEGDQPPKPIE
jgi:hypothetical protein